MELTSVSAIRGVTPHDVVPAVEAYLDGAGLRHARASADDVAANTLSVVAWRDGWSVVTWPSYFAPQDLAACEALSRRLATVVSAVTTTDDEGWAHTLFGCGTPLDRFHSFPAALVWEGEDVTLAAVEWTGDFELVARVLGVDACVVRRHFCQATSTSRGHPGREREGYRALWAALGIRPGEDPQPWAVLSVEPVWFLRVTAR